MQIIAAMIMILKILGLAIAIVIALGALLLIIKLVAAGLSATDKKN